MRPSRVIAALALTLPQCGRPGARMHAESQPHVVDEDSRRAPTSAASHEWRGLVAPRRTVELRSIVDGVVVEFPAQLGDHFADGSRVATLDNTDLRHRLRLAEAVAHSAGAALSLATGDRDYRRRQLAQVESLGPVVATAERDDARHRAAQSRTSAGAARDDLDGASAEAARLRSLVDGLALHAPFDAELAAIYCHVGQRLGPGEAIARLVSTERVLRFAVERGRVSDVGLGTPVEFVPAGAATSLRATVTAMAPEVDAAGLVVVEATFAVPAAPARAGVQGEVRLAGQRSDGPTEQL